MSFHQSPFAPMGSPQQKKKRSHSYSHSGFAIVRADLRKQKQEVPIGNLYFGGKTPLPCRWKNQDEENEQFEVFFKGRWRKAMSIDFDFPTHVSNTKR